MTNIRNDYEDDLDGFNEIAQFTKTQRGAPMVVYSGYTYVQDRQFLGSVNWRCSLYRRLKCRSRVIMKNINGVNRLKFTNAVHTHLPQRDDEEYNEYLIEPPETNSKRKRKN